MKSLLTKLKTNILESLKKTKNNIQGGMKKISSSLKSLTLQLVLSRPFIALAFFIVGARSYETGYLAQKMGWSLKGATVYLSGPCNVNGVPRIPALTEDQVKITAQFPDKIVGVVRKTREIIECDPKMVAMDKWPMLANFFKTTVKVPELTQLVNNQQEPEWKKLSKKTLSMSGSCLSPDGKIKIPPFTDELVEVTNVESSQDKPGEFTISGIRKKDNVVMSCPNGAVSYAIYEEKPVEAVVSTVVLASPTPEKPLSYINKVLLVTGPCYPDHRLPKHLEKQKVAYYPLVNSPIQVTEEKFDQEHKHLVYLAGALLQNGALIECLSDRTPFNYRDDFDPNSMALKRIRISDQGGVVDDVAKEQKATQPEQQPQVNQATPANAIIESPGEAAKPIINNGQ